MSVDFGIDPKTNDIAYENGRMKLVSGQSEVIQRVRTCLRRIQGEWFLYETAGLPYFNGSMLGAKDYEFVKLIIRQEVLKVAGVSNINSINLIIDTDKKHVSVYMEIVINSRVYSVTEEL